MQSRTFYKHPKRPSHKYVLLKGDHIIHKLYWHLKGFGLIAVILNLVMHFIYKKRLRNEQSTQSNSYAVGDKSVGTICYAEDNMLHTILFFSAAKC